MKTTLIRGNLVSDEEVIDVKKKHQLSQEDVLKLWGPPSYTADNKWYYMSRSIVYLTIYKEIQDQKIVIVSFDDAQKIIDVKSFSRGQVNVEYHPPVIFERNILSSYWDNLVVSFAMKNTQYSKKNFLPQHF